MNFSKPTELSGDWENVRTREKSLDRMDFPSSTFLLCSANWDRIGPGFEWMGPCWGVQHTVLGNKSKTLKHYLQ